MSIWNLFGGDKKYGGEVSGYPVFLIDEFAFKVPDGYDHALQIEVFKSQNQDDFERCDILEEHHKNVDDHLIPGAAYTTVVFRIGKSKEYYKDRDGGREVDDFAFYKYMETVKTQGCIDFLKKESSLFVGAQGVSFIWQFIKKEKLEKSSPIVVFDTSTHNYIWNSVFGIGSNGQCYTLETVEIERSGWDPGIYLLSLSRISEDTFNQSELRSIKIPPSTFFTRLRWLWRLRLMI